MIREHEGGAAAFRAAHKRDFQIWQRDAGIVGVDAPVVPIGNLTEQHLDIGFSRQSQRRIVGDAGDVVADRHTASGQGDLDQVDGVAIDFAQLPGDVLEFLGLQRLVRRAEKNEAFLVLLNAGA